MDIGVIEEDGVINARGLNGLHYLAGAGRAAGVQQQFVSAVWQGKLRTNEGAVLMVFNNMLMKFMEL